MFLPLGEYYLPGDIESILEMFNLDAYFHFTPAWSVMPYARLEPGRDHQLYSRPYAMFEVMSAGSGLSKKYSVARHAWRPERDLRQVLPAITGDKIP